MNLPDSRFVSVFPLEQSAVLDAPHTTSACERFSNNLPIPEQEPRRIRIPLQGTIVNVDEQERIVWCDQGMEVLFGYPPQQLAGRAWQTLIAKESQLALRKLMHQVGTPDHPYTVALANRGIRGRHQNGNLFPLEGMIVRLHAPHSFICTLLLETPDALATPDRAKDQNPPNPLPDRPCVRTAIQRVMQRHRRTNQSFLLLAIEFLPASPTQPQDLLSLTRRCAGYLRHFGRSTDTISLLRPSVLTILFENINTPRQSRSVIARTREQVQTLLEREGGAQAGGFALHSVSYPQDGIDPEGLLQQVEKCCTPPGRKTVVSRSLVTES